MATQQNSRPILAPITLLVLCTSLLLAVLVTVAPTRPAAAQQAIDQVCVDGVLVDGACEVSTNEAPACEPETCAVTVDRPVTCEGVADCAVLEPAEQGPSVCPLNAHGSPEQGCFLHVARGPDGCPTSPPENFVSVELADGTCATEVAAASGSYSCEGRVLLGRTCARPGEPVFGFCPAGSEPANGSCVDFTVDGLSANCGLLNESFEALRCIEPTLPLPTTADACHVDAQFFDGSCLSPVAGLRASLCGYIEEPGDWQARSDDSDCRTTTRPVSAACPSGYSDDDYYGDSSRWGPVGGCFRYQPVALQPCPSADPIGAELPCFGDATLVAGASCTSGSEPYALIRNLCVNVSNATWTNPICPSGSLDDAQGCYIKIGPGGRGCPPGFGGDILCWTSNGQSIDGACPDPSELNISGNCIRFAMPQPDTTSCTGGFIGPPGDGACRYPIPKAGGALTCADPAARRTGPFCIVLSTYPDSDYVCTAGALAFVDEMSPPICIAGDAQTPNCGDGRYDYRRNWCVLNEPFVELTCPALFTSLEGRSLCVRRLPRVVEVQCTRGILRVDEADINQCWQRSGPQPGGCLDLQLDDQCYRFVPHRLACAIEGCVVSVPPVTAAPLAERGDVDCNGQIILLDAFLLARAIADSDLARETTCADATANGGVRITAADLATDGTIDSNDAKRLLQCIVDENLATCSG